jgi:hypothetical protein
MQNNDTDVYKIVVNNRKTVITENVLELSWLVLQ